MIKQFVYRGNTYGIARCTQEDIPSHLEKVLSFYRPEEVDIQQYRMIDAVIAGCAYKLVDVSNNETKVFAYYEQVSKLDVIGIALWWSSIKLFAIFGVWFRGRNNQFVHIQPHSNKIPFVFLLEQDTIKRYHFKKLPLVVDMFSPKCRRVRMLYDRLNVEEL